MDGPTSQDDDLRAQVKALQREGRDDSASKQTLYSRLCGAREDIEEAGKANAALLQQVRDLQGQVMTEQATFQEAESIIHWQHQQISQLQEELRIQGELQEDLEEELQARSSAALPTGGGMDATFDRDAYVTQWRLICTT